MKAEEETRRWAFEQCRLVADSHEKHFSVGDIVIAADLVTKWLTTGEVPTHAEVPSNG